MLAKLKTVEKKTVKARKMTSNNLVMQKTLKSEICFVGVGVHSGKKIQVRMKPAEVNTGIVFRRVDIVGGGVAIKAHVSNVVDTKLCSCIGDGKGVNVSTVEHIMAAFHACGIDNVEVELNGGEVPVLDGSATQFVFLIEAVGVQEQDAPKKAIRVLKEISYVDEKNCAVTLLPANSGLEVNFEIDFPHHSIGKQSYSLDLNAKSFKSEISKARTFGFRKEIEYLRSIGLARGGSLENAILVDEDGIVNDDGLRYENEFVRHKTLDAVGDLYLAGCTLIGTFYGSRSGHAHTSILLEKMFADKDAYEIVDLTEDMLEVSKKQRISELKVANA